MSVYPFAREAQEILIRLGVKRIVDECGSGTCGDCYEKRIQRRISDLFRTPKIPRVKTVDSEQLDSCICSAVRMPPCSFCTSQETKD